ncbi:DNA methyltransferase [Reticulibacter mediterranei]|uniref:site-specific DNA-methyltransferase (adenine-specific) n=1 Tax=Reticulibacter mediterranei TaxID=2778369 RepID=A0A8J3N549_9CHLR|nr:type ISP restriction/modification enzyme [Reticulibacter mediterranei]GHO94787.1 DNA methyltransferase [Reticulibacter mediterranei]
MSAEINIVVEYLNRLWENHITGVKETSNYPALANLFNEIGKKLQVRCIIHPRSKGDGIPDGGFFTLNQFKIAIPDTNRMLTQTPERGAIEVKSTREDVLTTVNSKQVAKYLKQYGQVLVTNFYDFQLIVQDGTNVKLLERFRLAESEAKFWQAAKQPRSLAVDKGEQLVEYLKRVMLQAAPLIHAQDVAWFLASYARDARIRIEHAELAALTRLRTALEEALGMQFTGERGDHFFRSTLIQTLFYGVFSAWVLWNKTEEGNRPGAYFDWRVSGWLLHVPMVSSLFSQVVNRNQLAPLGLVEVMNWTGNALNRIDREAFFASFDEGHAVQYFYEPFLEAYDPELRDQLGVWYTPREIIEYMVERVDKVLRTELGITSGLADPNVYVLDPCCGTGSYVVAVLRRIAKTLEEQGADALTMLDVKRAATERVFGFEILPAPFVVAHLQLGLLLQQLGAPIAEDQDERAAIYLTNALTGWIPVNPEKERYVQATLSGWPELKEERDAAQHVKQQTPILVIIGNPPYNAFAGTSPEEEGDLVQPYKQGLVTEWGIKKFNLDELYARFFRLAERRIANMTRKGIVCFISNYSWLADPSYVVLRQHLLSSFDKIWIENLHGDRAISEYAPDGKTSETIFAVQGFSPGITRGTAISLWVKSGMRCTDQAEVVFRNNLTAAKAADRRAELLASLHDPSFVSHYVRAEPCHENRYSFRPSNVAARYREWPKLNEFANEASNGLMEKRGGALIDIDKKRLEQRMQMYYDPHTSWEELTTLSSGLTKDAARFDPKRTRAKVLAAEKYQSERLRRYFVRPFEMRWCYYSPVRPLWNEPRPSLWAQCWEGNSFVLSRMKGTASPEGVPFYFVGGLSDDHLLMADAVCFPIRLRQTVVQQITENLAQSPLFTDSLMRERIVANLSVKARQYLVNLGISDPDSNSEAASLIWMHSLAIGFTPAYLEENSDGIREDWPRIPLPTSAEQLRESAILGTQLAALLDTVQPFDIGANPALRKIGVLISTGKKNITPESLEVRGGWGHAGKDGVTMPGRGKSIERSYREDELAQFAVAGLSNEDVQATFGTKTYDIYLNEHIYWENIPSRIWDYRIGGYQVIKKWLSYREYTFLGRSLTTGEAREVTSISRRLAAILLLEPTLNANYRKIAEAVYAWGD